MDLNHDRRILVTGGTGLLGRQVVSRLRTAGHEVRVASRKSGVDLRSGLGVREAVADVDVIVHCATAFGRRQEVRLADTLVEAARRAGGPHLVYVSIVGVDRVPLGYYQGKLAAERLIERSGLPCTIQRATQFHDLVRVILAKAATVPVMPVPGFRFQPIDVGEVADRLAELAGHDPAGRVPDIAGPKVHSARELARMFLQAIGRRRLVVPIRLPGRTFRAYRAGGNLAPDHATGRIAFADHLAGHPDPLRASYRA